jgi:hypothetical protein
MGIYASFGKEIGEQAAGRALVNSSHVEVVVRSPTVQVHFLGKKERGSMFALP